MTTTPAGFDLRALVREVCDTSVLTDPPALAKEVARRIDEGDLREALEQVLPVFVQHVVSRRRGDSSDPPTGQMNTGTQPAGAGRGPTRIPAQRSRKVAGIREAWRKHLRDRIAVGPDRSDWKFLGDCTRDDLGYASAIRRRHAETNAAAADRLDGLAELLAEHGVERVADLPDPMLAGALDAAA